MKSKILIVDDASYLRELMFIYFENAGFVALTAADGEEGLHLAKAEKPDAIITDLDMPKMDGLQLLAAIKADVRWRQVPVVMITTEGGEAKVAEAVRLGAAGYVRKPFTADQIKEKLTGLLESVNA